MSALGESFRTARESQGLSLSDAAERIHIRSVYLAAIEAEDWQSIGPAVYVKGFVRSYARFLGLDPDAAIARVTSSMPAGALDTAPAASPARDSVRPSGPRPLRNDVPRGGVSVWAGLGIAVALLLVAFVGYEYLAFRQGDSHPGRPMAAAPTSPIAVQPSPPVQTLRSAASKQPDLEPSGKNGAKSSGFAVRLRDSSWLRVTVDGKVAMEGLFAAGTQRSFAGRSVTVRVGNAGGVDVTVDGKDLGPIGGIGDVAERSYQL